MLTIAGFSFCVNRTKRKPTLQSLWLSDSPADLYFAGTAFLLAADFFYQPFYTTCGLVISLLESPFIISAMKRENSHGLTYFFDRDSNKFMNRVKGWTPHFPNRRFYPFFSNYNRKRSPLSARKILHVLMHFFVQRNYALALQFDGLFEKIDVGFFPFANSNPLN